MSINKALVLSELDSILKSRHFRSRRVLRFFLHYVVTQTLADNAAKITQYTIAVEGLGKSADFNSAADPLIRIQAGRLRKLLEEYYTTEGRFNPIRIELATRGYHATFTHQTTQAVYQPITLEDIPSSLSQGPSIVCIPRTFVMDDASSWPFITRLTRDYVNILTHFNGCQVVFADEMRWQANTTVQQYNTDFALFLDLHAAPAKHYSLKCSLIHTPTEQVVWAQSFSLNQHDTSQASLQPIFKRIAHDTLGYEQGVAHHVWARHLLDSGKPIAAQHQVMLSLRQQLWERSPQAFLTSLQICEKRLAQAPNDVQAMIVYADYCRTDYLLKYQQIETLEERLAYVTDALLQLAPGNAYSHLYYALSCLLLEEHDMCLEAVQQAQAINPLDVHLNVLAGIIHLGLGQEQIGLPLIQQSIAISPFYPDWYHIPLSQLHYRQGRYLEARQEAQKIKLKHVWDTALHNMLLSPAKQTL
ncbi:hypothetical protein SAMN05660964_03121 [Thiothrix caldifontis]|uniref:TolB amino-terminal domain-containing protein n=1 Tax=Thiothrix caldifontis TaxID=525918 RepID=A0A1H4FU07_9GAMM|nr:tetratricopeptide repeat protein [Thiothrix caldifontis]SEB00631.1 hypothetical protein SAMN05660964_03121 [Thiothrix caldifontis]